MKTIQILSLSTLLFLFVSCQNNKITPIETSQTVVLCFNHYDPPRYKTSIGFFHIPIPKVAYIDSIGTLVEYAPTSGTDTLILPCANEFVELALSYRDFEYIYYPLSQEDTLHISMDSLNYPILQSKHHPERNRIYNMNSELRQGRTHSGLEAKTCLGSDWAFIAQKIDYIRTQEWGAKYVADYCPLDSLHAMFESYQEAYMDTINIYKQQQAISDDIYQRYTYLLQLKEHEAQRMLNEDSTYYRTMEANISDAYATYPSYHEFLDYYMHFFNYHIRRIAKSQGSHYDWRQTFDELSLKPFQAQSMRIVLQRCIREIGDNFSAADLTKYLDKYTKITGDSVLYNQMVGQYNLSADANQLLLKDLQGKSLNFNQMLEANQGKVIYIDFWASWCVPCREEMEPAAALREQYKGKDVVFVYLAYKDTETSWKKAAEQEGLKELSTNYFIVNPKNSKMLELIKLELIPRYILFDKYGKLVEMNAPRPSSKEITATLNSYL